MGIYTLYVFFESNNSYFVLELVRVYRIIARSSISIPAIRNIIPMSRHIGELTKNIPTTIEVKPVIINATEMALPIFDLKKPTSREIINAAANTKSITDNIFI